MMSGKVDATRETHANLLASIRFESSIEEIRIWSAWAIPEEFQKG